MLVLHNMNQIDSKSVYIALPLIILRSSNKPHAFAMVLSLEKYTSSLWRHQLKTLHWVYLYGKLGSNQGAWQATRVTRPNRDDHMKNVNDQRSNRTEAKATEEAAESIQTI